MARTAILALTNLDVLYVCDVIIKINVRYVIINRFLRYKYIQ